MLLRGGHYNEQVAVTNLHGTDERRIVIQAFRNEQVIIDCCEDQFLNPSPKAHREPVPGTTVDEYVWTGTFSAKQADQVARGAFIDGDAHIRLVTYSQHNDLVARSQLDPRLDARPRAARAGPRLPLGDPPLRETPGPDGGRRRWQEEVSRLAAEKAPHEPAHTTVRTELVWNRSH